MRINILFFLLFAGTAISFSQWECRSNLSAHLNPVFKSSVLSSGVELTGSRGYVAGDPVSTSMAFLGLDFSTHNHQLYFEGGFKHWYRKDVELGHTFTKYLTGLREASYSYISPSLKLKLGVQQFGGSEYFLVNERGVGASVSKKVGGLKIDLDAASVTKSLARNGIFCSNSYIYDITPSRSLPLGNNLLLTNFALCTITKKTGEKIAGPAKVKVTDNAEDEFDEFQPVGEEPEEAKIKLESYGAILYSEFGYFYPEKMFDVGLMAELSVCKIFTLKTEGIFQNFSENNMLLIFLRAERVLDWKSENKSTLSLAYLGNNKHSGGLTIAPRFSNLFYGEVYRMDAIDMPLVNMSLKHQFVKIKLSLKLQYSKQLQNQEFEEIDFSASKFFMKGHFRLTLLSGALRSSLTEGSMGMGRLELRMFF